MLMPETPMVFPASLFLIRHNHLSLCTYNTVHQAPKLPATNYSKPINANFRLSNLLTSAIFNKSHPPLTLP
jgi:hypothetical protein